MNRKDIFYYAGFIGGMVIGSQVMAILGWGGIIRLLGLLAAGVLVGRISERVCAGARGD